MSTAGASASAGLQCVTSGDRPEVTARLRQGGRKELPCIATHWFHW